MSSRLVLANQTIPPSVKEWDECDKMNESADKIQLWFTSIALLAVIFCGMIFIPKILTHIKGLKKMTVLLQQLCLVLHLLLIILHHSLATKGVLSYFATSSLFNNDLTEAVGRGFDMSVIGKTISIFFSQYFHAQYFFFSFIQSLDAYNMVCKPFNYKEFSCKIHLCVLMMKGCLVCLLYSSQHLISMVFPLAMSLKDFDRLAFIRRMNIKWWMNVFDVVKILSCKVVFTVVVLLMAKKIKTNFKESDELVNNQRNKTVQKRLFRFALIPIFLCFIFLPYEGLNAFYSFFYFGITNCSYVSLFPMKVAVQIFRVVTMVAASFISYAAYVLLFSNLRKSLQCSNHRRLEST